MPYYLTGGEQTLTTYIMKIGRGGSIVWTGEWAEDDHELHEEDEVRRVVTPQSLESYRKWQQEE